MSIPTNIAEGCGKGSDANFGRYLQIAMGSASELEYLLLLSCDLGYLTDASYQELAANLVETRKMLNVLIQRVKSSRYKPMAKSS